ncbi:protein of unknown function [Desulfotomaculum arcticum]|uniref:Transcobalamin-like C-terminal domain-containing protein n=1 Tax=Desulfotruncus arcticus DSM 17038 TaxID=1121424 RepID=A0A1I2SVS9_9FIRM|nr:DUF4430 domain-containing protein [Desulfotruncus arcticus]SFG56882.1 protein of unknown function [Desulfotomaculum arcticum] [Desulfotruncus arcticus DSM 17038]
MKKLLTLVIAFTLAFSLQAMPVFADDQDIVMLTLDDSKDFTVVGAADYKEGMKVVGLDSSYQKLTIQNQAGISWFTSDAAVAKFLDEDEEEQTSITGTDTVTVLLTGPGRATITATFNGMTIDSNVMVEETTQDPDAENIDVQVVGIDSESFTFNDLDVDLFSLKDDVFGSGFDDADVLKEDATALHALLYALELKYDPDEGEPWDWDWVAGNTNVVISSEGSYVEKIEDDVNDGTTGWQYTVNNQDPGYAGSIYELNDGDSVVWEYTAW